MRTLDIGVKDNDYGYIQVFIDYLKQIVEIIVNLFKAVSSKEETTAVEG